MPKEAKTEDVQRDRGAARPLDAADRRILAALSENAELSYAALGAAAGLSAPAAHERVRRLRACGAIRGKAVLLDGAAVGKPLLAFVLVDTEGWRKEQALAALGDLPEVEELHSVAGDACMLLKLRCADAAALEAILRRLYAVEGVTSTRSYVALNTLLERPTQAGVTPQLAER